MACTDAECDGASEKQDGERDEQKVAGGLEGVCMALIYASLSESKKRERWDRQRISRGRMVPGSRPMTSKRSMRNSVGSRLSVAGKPTPPYP